MDPDGANATDIRTAPLDPFVLGQLHAKFAHLFGLDQVDRGVLSIDYTKRSALVSIHYRKGAEKLKHTERHDF